MAGKSSEDYWNTSSNASFNFDDDIETEKQYTSFYETSKTVFTDAEFGMNLQENNAQIILPIHSLITKNNLDAVLNDVQIPAHSSIPSVEETITKIFLGMPFSLFLYRSLEQKLQLLDEAVKIADGNIILIVLLYLKKSLKPAVLYQNLTKRKVALDHYMNYLMQESKFEDLGDLYMVTGNYSDIVYLFYVGSTTLFTVESIHTKLSRFLAESQSKLDLDKSAMFADYLNFLNWQIESKVHTNTTIEHLAILYKTELERKNESTVSVMTFRKKFKISDFQFEWVQLNVLGFLALWEKITQLFIKPNWLTKKNSIKTVIDVHLFISTLYKHKAPSKVIEEFLNCVVDNNTSMILAKKLKCHKFVIDTYTTQRDRLAILSYRNCLTTQSEEQIYADSILCSIDKKWKN